MSFRISSRSGVGHPHSAAGGRVAAGVRQGQVVSPAVQPSDDALAVHGGNVLVPGLPGPWLASTAVWIAVSGGFARGLVLHGGFRRFPACTVTG